MILATFVCSLWMNKYIKHIFLVRRGDFTTFTTIWTIKWISKLQQMSLKSCMWMKCDTLTKTSSLRGKLFCSLLGTKLMVNCVRFQFSDTSVRFRLKVKVKVKETWDCGHLYPCCSLTVTIITLLLLNTDTVLRCAGRYLYFCSSKDCEWRQSPKPLSLN